MNTPSFPFIRARSMKVRSTLPVHIKRTIFISGLYCSLETPAKSAAEYPHQLQRNPRILGLNSTPLLMIVSPPIRPSSFDRSLNRYEVRYRRVDLGQDRIVGVVSLSLIHISEP